MSIQHVDDKLTVECRDGPGGSCAALVGGPEIWKVVRDVKAARIAEPYLTEAELLDMLFVNTGVSPAMIRVALDHYRAAPSEVNVLIRRNERAAARLLGQLGSSEPALQATPRRRSGA